MNEPVAWMKPNGEVSVTQGEAFCIPLYTHPADLTDEEILELVDTHLIVETVDIGMGDCIAVTDGEIDFARAILKKASEK